MSRLTVLELELHLRAPLSWFLTLISADTPKENWNLRSPSLVILALRDYVCTPVLAKASMEKYGGPDVEYVEVNSGHWPHLEHTDQVNAALRRWLEARAW